MTTAIYIVLGIFGFIIIISMFRTKKFLLSLFMTALQGIASLIAANFIGGFFGVHLSVNAFFTRCVRPRRTARNRNAAYNRYTF